MSYDVCLCDPVTGEVLQLDQPHMMAGGTYAIGGTQETWLNITYNYGRWYRKPYAFGTDGIFAIEGMSGVMSIPVLEAAIKGLEQSDENLTDEEIARCKADGVNGYWIPTRENAIKPLYQLLALARMRPDGVWDIF